jgi:hypothetical protein
MTQRGVAGIKRHTEFFVELRVTLFLRPIKSLCNPF